MGSMLRLATVVLLTTTCLLTAHAVDRATMDVLNLRSEERPVWCLILTERITDEDSVIVEWRRSATDRRVNESRWSDVESIQYFWMRSSGYQAALEAKRQGRYREAAVRFEGLTGISLTGQAGADQGDDAEGGGTISGASMINTESRVVYNLAEMGECLELAGRWGDAAQAWGYIVENYPTHRRWPNAAYRYGVALARDGQVDQAEAVANLIDEFGRSHRLFSRMADNRALAIRVSILAAREDYNQASRQVSQVSFHPDNETDIWFHWTNYWATIMRETGEPQYLRSAARLYGEMVEYSAGHPQRRALASLGRGLSLAEAGQDDAALIELLRLDALPYGSPSDKCIARYHAGRIMWDQSQANQNHAEDTVREFAESQAQQARTLLRASANANLTVDVPERQLARDLLATLPSEESDEADEESDLTDPAAP